MWNWLRPCNWNLGDLWVQGVGVGRQCLWIQFSEGAVAEYPESSPLTSLLVLGASAHLHEQVGQDGSQFPECCTATHVNPQVHSKLSIWDVGRHSGVPIHWRSLDKVTTELNFVAGSFVGRPVVHLYHQPLLWTYLLVNGCLDCTWRQYSTAPHCPNTHVECEWVILPLGFCPRPWLYPFIYI